MFDVVQHDGCAGWVLTSSGVDLAEFACRIQVAQPAGQPIALPLRLQFEKLLPGLSRLPVQIAPGTLFVSSRKCWECSLIGVILAFGCGSPFSGSALVCEAKANFHPLAFYTIEVTSPGERSRLR